MVTHPTLQNASPQFRYPLDCLFEDRLNASAAALLQDNFDQESLLLVPPLLKLFSNEQTPSA